MNQAQEEHLEDIKYEFTRLVDAKYRAGAAEHGGELYKKKNIIDMLIEEHIDGLVYALTLKQQIEDAGVELGEVDE